MTMERKTMLQGSSSDLNNVAFLPSDILFRRLSVCDIHRLSLDNFVSFRKQCIQLFHFDN